MRVAFAHASSAPAVAGVTGSSAPAFAWLLDPDAAWLVGLHEHEGDRYFVKEPFEALLWWMALRPLLALAGASDRRPEAIRTLARQISACGRAAAAAGYRLDVA